MAKSVLWEVAEFLFTWFGVFDFLTKTNWNGQYKPKARSSGASRPRQTFSSSPFSSTSGTNTPKKKKKDELNAYTREGLNIMIVNAKKARENYSGLKSWYKPNKNNIFSWLK